MQSGSCTLNTSPIFKAVRHVFLSPFRLSLHSFLSLFFLFSIVVAWCPVHLCRFLWRGKHNFRAFEAYAERHSTTYTHSSTQHIIIGSHYRRRLFRLLFQVKHLAICIRFCIRYVNSFGCDMNAHFRFQIISHVHLNFHCPFLDDLFDFLSNRIEFWFELHFIDIISM